MRHLITAVFFCTALLLFTVSTYAQEKKDEESGSRNNSTITYKSRHGFKIDFPKSWRLETRMEGYESLDEAEKDGGNYFSIMSYQDDDPRMKGFHFFPADTLKIDVWVFPDYRKSLAELITETKGITKIDDFTIGGKKAKKVWQRIDPEMLDEGEVHSIYFVDGGKKVIFTSYPEYTNMGEQFEEVVESFRFE